MIDPVRWNYRVLSAELLHLHIFRSSTECWLSIFLFLGLGSKPVFMSFSDTESVFLDVALLLEILQGSPFHLMTIWANTVHSLQATSLFRRQTISSPSPT